MIQNRLIGRTWSNDPAPAPYPPWLRLGYMTPERIYTAPLYFPGAMDRFKIMGGHDIEPFFLVVGDSPGGLISIASRDTEDRRVTPIGEFTMLSIGGYSSLASSGNVSNVAVSIYDVDGEGRPQRRWNRQMINLANFSGKFEPMTLRQPVICPEKQPILVRITNQSTSTNSVQIVFAGVRRRYS